MVDEKAEFRTALEEVRSGSPDAVWKFIEDYGPHIRRVARRYLDIRIQSKFDSLDFVQMVWVSFFRDPEKIRSFHRPDDICRYLGRMVRNKVCNEHRRGVLAAKRDVTREQSLENTSEPRDPVDLTPSQVAIAREEWRRLIGCESSRNQQIAHLRLGGATYVEISRQLEINERTVRRVIERLLRNYEANQVG